MEGRGELEKLDQRTMKQYKALLREEPMVREAIEKLYERLERVPIVAGKVSKSGEDFPYIEGHMTVEMLEPREASEIKTRIRYKECRLDEIIRTRTQIESFVSNIKDSTDRQIMELTFQEGLTQNEVAEVVGYSRGRISQIISKYLKD